MYPPRSDSDLGFEKDMYKKLVLLILLAHTFAVQAAPMSELILKKDTRLTEMVLKHTASLKLRSAIALIYDERGKRTLYSKNANIVAPIASISKLMTAMVVLDAHLPMDEIIRISRADVDRLKGTHSRMRPGMTLKRGELLQLALMASENRAAAALARTYPGGTKAAVKMMNIKAHELNMYDTLFLEPTGLNSGNVSTGRDLVKMVLAAKRYKLIRMATTSSSHTVRPSGYRSMVYRNTNPLVKNASWNIGVSKTGFINEAGRCLVMEAHIHGHPVVIVLLDSWGKRTRIGDANRVKKWIEKSLVRTSLVRYRSEL